MNKLKKNHIMYYKYKLINISQPKKKMRNTTAINKRNGGTAWTSSRNQDTRIAETEFQITRTKRNLTHLRWKSARGDRLTTLGDTPRFKEDAWKRAFGPFSKASHLTVI
jgi:hypothetical protein